MDDTKRAGFRRHARETASDSGIIMKRTVLFIINGASKAVHAVININNSMRFPLEAFKILIESL